MEEYTAYHSETVEDLLNWPWLRVEKFWEAHQKRQTKEMLDRRKQAMINALYSNSNYDGEGHKTREKIIEGLENSYNEAVTGMYNGFKKKRDEMKENPFLAAIERGLEKQGVPALEETPDYQDLMAENTNG